MINKEMKQLINEFIKISRKRWIKGVNNSTNGVGLTFEKQIGKPADSMFFPDYNGIEIKCTQRFSRYPITLFSTSFDGPSFYEMNRLLQKYGKQDITYKNKKNLISNLKNNQKILVNDKYYFKLKIDKKEEKIYLEIYDLNNNLLENESYIDFKTIKAKLETKLSFLALVYASKKTENGDNYFRYYKIEIFELISFDKFIDLIEKNKINTTIMGRVSKSGSEKGRQRNKNIVFQIPKENIELLFHKIISKNMDSYNKTNKNFTIFSE